MKPFKKQYRHEEDNEQAAFVEHFQFQYPSIFPYLYAIPNGGKRNLREAVRLKAAGVKPGIPDLFLSVALRGYHGMYIEMKSKTGRLSDAQKKIHAMFLARGYHVVTCHSSMDAMFEVTKYLKGYIEPCQETLEFVKPLLLQGPQ